MRRLPDAAEACAAQGITHAQCGLNCDEVSQTRLGLRLIQMTI
jgi:hypothetical protein